jgi:hypothetical protein
VALAARDEAHGVAETASQLQLSSEDSGVTFQVGVWGGSQAQLKP